MKKLSTISRVVLLIAFAIFFTNCTSHVSNPKETPQPKADAQEAPLPKTNAERYPERFMGVDAGCAQFYESSYYKFLLSSDGKYPFECDFFDVESPMRVALVNMLGGERFAILNTYYLTSVPIIVTDKWVIIQYMWLHRAYISATIFVDTANRKMYVEWVDPDNSEITLYYELGDHQKAEPATILSRQFPDSVRQHICFGLIPDFDPDKTTSSGSVL